MNFIPFGSVEALNLNTQKSFLLTSFSIDLMA